MTIKVLHCVSSLGGGGVARVLLNYFSITRDCDIQNDFIVHGSKVGELEETFRDLGCNITHAPPKSESPLANARVIGSAISTGQYDAVHAHQNFSNALPLLLAKSMGVRVRISHGHGFPKPPQWAAWLARRAILATATHLLACSQDVGKWIHGVGWGKSRYFPFVMNNAINSQDFLSRAGDRDASRKKFGFDGYRVLLQIGRLSSEKNHEFSLELMDYLRDEPKWKLAIVGAGALLEDLRASVRRRGLEDSVIFMGFRDDIAAVMNSSDVLILPSHTEGFPMVTTESQAIGLPTVVSPAVPSGAGITDLFERVPLEVDLWKDALARSLTRRRNDHQDEIAAMGFDVHDAAVTYVEYLQKAIAARKPSLRR